MQAIRTVGDLRDLLKDVPDDAPLSVAPTPDITGWTNPIIGCLARFSEGIILALSEETAYTTELDLTFCDLAGEKVRPV